MKGLIKLGTGLCLAAGLSFGITTYRGQLMDASCSCAPTTSTDTFAVHTNGKFRMLDPAGNEKAKTALQEGHLKRDKKGDMPVVIDGTRHGNTIKVESIRAHGSDVSVH